MTDLAFALGCFHFGLRRTPPDGYTVESFIQDVEKSLKAVPNIDNVRVRCDSDFHSSPLSLPNDEPLSLTSGDRPFPAIQAERISFELLIPFGLQKELRNLHLRHSVVRTFTERFRVEIRYMFRNPVAVFTLVSPSEEPKPSEAVIIIRRLLEREYARQEDGLIDFQFMGPSPLHADFHLTAEPEHYGEEPWDFDLSITHTRGYDRYDIAYNVENFPEPDSALNSLLVDLLDELDVYYLATQLAREDMHSWHKLQELSEDLSNLQEARGFKAYFARILKAPLLLDRAFVALTRFETKTLVKDSLMHESYEGTYSTDAPPYLKELVDRRLKESNIKYPSEQLSKLLHLYETRRLSAAELRVVLVSAVSGGAFGALVTTLLGGS